mgnify:FL=1
MKLTMLGTGNALVTECYNTCFVLSDGNDHFMVDGGGGMTVLHQLKYAGLDWRQMRTIFVTHKHIDHLLGIIWMMRMICQHMREGTYEGEATIYAHDEVIALLRDLAGKLLQLSNGAVYDEFHNIRVIHDKKLDALEDLIEAANGKPVLVMYAYQHDLTRIQQRFGKYGPENPNGVRELKTSTDLEDWNAGKIPVAVTQPASTGHGLNLQHGGSTIVWFGLNWSLELYEQANARLWRQGQKETVVVHHLVVKGTMDEQVMRALHEKAADQNALLAAVKARIQEVK